MRPVMRGSLGVFLVLFFLDFVVVSCFLFPFGSACIIAVCPFYVMAVSGDAAFLLPGCCDELVRGTARGSGGPKAPPCSGVCAAWVLRGGCVVVAWVSKNVTKLSKDVTFGPCPKTLRNSPRTLRLAPVQKRYEIVQGRYVWFQSAARIQ